MIPSFLFHTLFLECSLILVSLSSYNLSSALCHTVSSRFTDIYFGYVIHDVMKNATGSRSSFIVRTTTYLAAHTKRRPAASRSHNSEANVSAHNVSLYAGCSAKYMAALFVVFFLLNTSAVAATDSCMPGSTLCENNTIKICDLNSGIVELKCPENTFCKADIHGARCQPKKGRDSASDSASNDGSNSRNSNLTRPPADDDVENEERTYGSKKPKMGNESNIDDGENYLFRSARRAPESSAKRDDCSDSDGDESCIGDSYRKRKNSSNRESRLTAAPSTGRRAEQESKSSSSGKTRGRSWRGQAGKRQKSRRERSSGSLLSDAEAQEIADFEAEARLGSRGHDEYDRTEGANRMSSFHETNGMFGMSSRSNTALSEVMRRKEMMASERRGYDAEGEMSDESAHSHSPGLAHAILSKKEGNGTKNQKVIVLTVTKSMKSPPLEMHMEYTIPGSVTPVVKKFSSKDGETFTEASPSSQSSANSNASANPSGSDPKQGLLASASESQKSLQGLSSSGLSASGSSSGTSSASGSPSGTSGASAAPKDSSAPSGSAAPPSPSQSGSAPAKTQSSGSGSSAPSGGASSPSPSGSAPAKTQSGGQQSSSSGASSSSSASGSSASKAKLADATPSASGPGSAKTPQSSQSSSSSSSGGGGGSGKMISKEDLMAIMKEFSFNPNPEYVDIVLKGVEEKEKDEDLVPMFLAQLAHESGGFEHIEEIACKQSGGCPGQYGTGAPGKSYHGRGFIQLSWPDNYKKAGQALGMGDELYANPEKVAEDPKLAFDVSWWYWDSIVRPAVSGKKEFGATTKAINGALECGGGGNEKAQKRYKIYEAICKKMSKTPAPNTGC